MAAAVLPVTITRSPVSAPSAPAVPANEGNGAADVAGLMTSRSPASACEPSETVTAVTELLMSAASVPAACRLYQPHVPTAQILFCGVDAEPHGPWCCGQAPSA